MAPLQSEGGSQPYKGRVKTGIGVEEDKENINCIARNWLPSCGLMRFPKSYYRNYLFYNASKYIQAGGVRN